MNPLLLTALLLAGAGGDQAAPSREPEPDPDPEPREPRRDSVPFSWTRPVETPRGPLAVACPESRCLAAVGQDCRQSTLGRWTFHRARVEAAKVQS